MSALLRWCLLLLSRCKALLNLILLSHTSYLKRDVAEPFTSPALFLRSYNNFITLQSCVFELLALVTFYTPKHFALFHAVLATSRVQFAVHTWHIVRYCVILPAYIWHSSFSRVFPHFMLG
jgi:hypothetical protein